MSHIHVDQIYENAVCYLRKELNSDNLNTNRIPFENELDAMESFLENLTTYDNNKSYSIAESFLERYRK